MSSSGRIKIPSMSFALELSDILDLFELNPNFSLAFPICKRSSCDAFIGSSSTMNFAPKSSSDFRVSKSTTSGPPRMGGALPRWTVIPRAKAPVPIATAFSAIQSEQKQLSAYPLIAGPFSLRARWPEVSLLSYQRSSRNAIPEEASQEHLILLLIYLLHIP